MKKLTSNDLKQISNLHNIYSKEVPDFIIEALNSKEMQRIKEIGQNCGRDYLSNTFQNFSYNYSRCEHSIGVALIVWRFTKNVKMTLAGLFHDIAAPTFSHVIDFLNGDSETQESTEELTYEIINDSKKIQEILKKYNLKTEDVSDYSMYPIADNKSPKLSADRLEYTCYMSTAMGLISFDELNELINDIYIVTIDNTQEMCFKNIKYAKKFAKLAIVCGRFMSSPISTVSNQFLADILKIAVDTKILTKNDFNTLTEDEIVTKIENCNNEKVKFLFKYFRTFDKVYESNSEDLSNYSINVKVKSRYINPLCNYKDSILRVSDIDSEIKNDIENFLKEANTKYFSINLGKENFE